MYSHPGRTTDPGKMVCTLYKKDRFLLKTSLKYPGLDARFITVSFVILIGS